MKRRILSLTLILVFSMATFALKKNNEKTDSEVNMVEPTTSVTDNTKESVITEIKAEPKDRVWTFTQYEYDLITEKQREAFIKRVTKISKKNPIISGITEFKNEKNLKEALKSFDKWSSIENKIKKECEDAKNLKACEEISKVRENILLENTTHR